MKTTDSKRHPYCQMVYAMIRDGKTDQEIWAVIQPMFNLEDKKKYLPRWYRCRLRRLGKIPNDTRIYNRRVEVRYE